MVKLCETRDCLIMLLFLRLNVAKAEISINVVILVVKCCQTRDFYNVVILVVKCCQTRDCLLMLLFWWLNVAKLGIVN